MSREDKHTLGKSESGDIVDAGELGPVLAKRSEGAAAPERPSAIHRCCGDYTRVSRVRVLAEHVRRVTAT